MNLIIGAWLCEKHTKELMHAGIKPIRKTAVADRDVSHECQEKDCTDVASDYLNFIMEIKLKRKASSK